MAFTDAQKVQIRRYCGYPSFGSVPIPNFAWRYSVQYGDLEFRMNNLSADEQNIVLTIYLAKLPTIEDDIYQVRENIDTARAAVWYRNARELKERVELFDYWRKKLCDFIGAEYGPEIQKKTFSIVV